MFKHPNQLLLQLSQDIRVFLRQSVGMSSTMPFTVLSSNEERTTRLHSRTDIHWFPYLMEALQEISPVTQGKDNFVLEFQKLYKNNPAALNFINEFKDTYNFQMAVTWYTREGILYSSLNCALRQLDQHKIFLFHFFIYDLSQQLKKEAQNSKTADWRNQPLYRGQRISKQELEFLKEHRTIYVNTFLSTTKSLILAEIYAGVGSHTCNRDSAEQPVIFKIGSCTWEFFAKHAAAIDHLSHFGGTEDEILFAPTYTFFPTAVEYDESTAVWNVTLVQLTDANDLGDEYLSYLIKLDIFLRTIIAEEATKNVATIDNDSQKLINDIMSIIHELAIDDDDIVTLASIPDGNINKNKCPFELKGIALFKASAPPRLKSMIPSLTMSMLYDCIATLFKCIGNYESALENYSRAKCYNADQNSIHNIMRKVKTAQIYKITGNQRLAWEMFQEISSETIINDELLDKLFTDIAVNKPLFKNEADEQQNYQKLNQYLQYVSTRADLKRFGFLIANIYRDLSESLYEGDNLAQIIEFLKNEIGIRKTIIRYDRSSRYELAHQCKNLADLYEEKNSVMAIKFYKEAVVYFKPFRKVGASDLIAICWCAIGSLRRKHNAKIFINAFKLLLAGTDYCVEMKVTNNIAQCYLCLAKSYARCSRLASLAVETSLQSLRLCLNHMPDNVILLDEDLDGCWEWTLSLFKTKSENDGSHVPTKEELYNMCKPSGEHPSLNKGQIVKILKATIKQLQKQLASMKKRRHRKGISLKIDQSTS